MEAAEPVAGRFIQFYDQQREWKIVDQQNVDSLYQLQAKNYRVDSGSKGIEEKTLALVQGLFSGREAHCFPLMKWSAPPGSAKPPPVAIWSTALRPVFWKWRCCTEKLAIRGGCIAALRSKLKPLAGREGWKRQKPRCSLISSGPSGSPGLLFGHLHHLRRQTFRYQLVRMMFVHQLAIGALHRRRIVGRFYSQHIAGIFEVGPRCACCQPALPPC